MDTRLRDSLASAMQRHDDLAAKRTPEAAEQLGAAGFTEEASLVGLRLLQEFEKYGSYLPPEQQQRALHLTTQEHSLRNTFGARPCIPGMIVQPLTSSMLLSHLS